jgi:hypothetical protein
MSTDKPGQQKPYKTLVFEGFRLYWTIQDFIILEAPGVEARSLFFNDLKLKDFWRLEFSKVDIRRGKRAYS